MRLVSGKPASSYPWYVRVLFRLQRRAYGHVLEPSLLWGRSPRVLLGLACLYGALDRRLSPLPPSLRSLVTVRVSQINQCAFCVDVNSATLIRRGVALEKVSALADWRASTLFDLPERLALEYAEAITLNQVTDPLRARVKAQWSDEAIVELTGLIAFQNLSSKFNAALDVPAQGFCLPVSARSPAYRQSLDPL
ncbi:MAG: carboxymuconolactone decarboxylase family protein [Proteobacteria bacterium]|nr:carboxymuconolactone decarboxylase family protein [Pseudomonadota bacterium]